MRLTTIKLAGFKSFVDPTTLHFPTNMTGVVGPNGCGKSNIIDAVRWVMGESAASRLRGDALTDVIFSGSSGRKPVGQAMVELRFDNGDGEVQGQFASYAEIAVRRTVSRDGQSQYFLNGARCRRRDITDLFLGTGLGPRSYSIIEQGMISNMIEAKPEQLRVHLEEAAGISKYKERRKETEARIKATRENLERVHDVREEVERQLERLDRQAQAAERWKALKESYKRKQAALHAMDYRDVQKRRAQTARELSEVRVEIDKAGASQTDIEAQLEAARESHHEAGEHLNQVQARVYRIGAEIARIEQQAQHNRELVERLEHASQDAAREDAELSDQIRGDRTQVDTLRAALADGEPRRETIEELKANADAALRDAEARLADWQQRWEACRREAAEAARAAEVERTRLDYLDRQSTDNARRREALEQESKSFDVAALEGGIARLEAEHEQAQQGVDTLEAELQRHKSRQSELKDAEHAAQRRLGDTRQALQSVRGRLASLETLQHAAMGLDDEAATAWLAAQGLGEAPRVGASLRVEAGWEAAVEAVLGDTLEGVLVADGAHRLAHGLAALEGADIALLDAAEQSGRAGTLAAHVHGPAPVVRMLGNVLTAGDVDAATGMVANLKPSQSVVTPAGEWLGVGWAQVRRSGRSQAGVLAREREIDELGAHLQELEGTAAAAQDELEATRGALAESEQAGADVQGALYQAHRQLSELAGQLQSRRGKLETARARYDKVRHEQEELADARDTLDTQTREVRARLDAAVPRMGSAEDQRRDLERVRRELLEVREEARLNAHDAATQAQELALGMESKRSALAALEQSLARMERQQSQLRARRDDLARQLEQGATPAAELDAQRQACLDERLEADQQLIDARRRVEDADAHYRQLDRERQRIEQQLAQLHETHAERRLADQALEMRAGQLAAEIEASGIALDELLESLPAAGDVESSKRELDALAARIERLEPVNLAAIQEREEQRERKGYLDAQVDDLVRALATLENAIGKIDRETRQLFKETFDKVDAGVRELFPRLFGGGNAYLELTDEDLLDTGVTIMARPPGKRISNITLLSGGEKAMTAVALVFAIFRLNPAPFCLLDEVDAPLDEANIGRFSGLVEEMSDTVQFILVSHNKAVMEAARQLCGVTMREPGVSRLVQVNLAEASKLAGVA